MTKLTKPTERRFVNLVSIVSVGYEFLMRPLVEFKADSKS
jgi:hypothetical protein